LLLPVPACLPIYVWKIHYVVTRISKSCGGGYKQLEKEEIVGSTDFPPLIPIPNVSHVQAINLGCFPQTLVGQEKGNGTTV